VRKTRTFGDALPSLRVSAQRTGDDGIKLHVFLLEIRTQSLSLLVAEFAQIVVIFCAKRSLAVAY
jgi:hypothetical protein